MLLDPVILLLKTLQLLPKRLEKKIKGAPPCKTRFFFLLPPILLCPNLASFHLHTASAFLLLRAFALNVPSARNAFPFTPSLVPFILQISA